MVATVAKNSPGLVDPDAVGWVGSRGVFGIYHVDHATRLTDEGWR